MTNNESVPSVWDRVQGYEIGYNGTATTPGYLGFMAYPTNASGSVIPGSVPIPVSEIPRGVKVTTRDDELTRFMLGQRSTIQEQGK